jgi:DNA-binding NarL/FixJ family response regulator
VRVLIIDDSAEFVRAVESFIATIPAVKCVGTARTGRHGIRMTEELQPDVVLLDWMMPGMNGLDTARAIKALPQAPRVILLSLLNGPECMADARAAGADAFLFKGELSERLPGLLLAISTDGSTET